jgi:hypothetical protein
MLPRLTVDAQSVFMSTDFVQLRYWSQCVRSYIPARHRHTDLKAHSSCSSWSVLYYKRRAAFSEPTDRRTFVPQDPIGLTWNVCAHFVICFLWFLRRTHKSNVRDDGVKRCNGLNDGDFLRERAFGGGGFSCTKRRLRVEIAKRSLTPNVSNQKQNVDLLLTHYYMATNSVFQTTDHFHSDKLGAFRNRLRHPEVDLLISACSSAIRNCSLPITTVFPSKRGEAIQRSIFIILFYFTFCQSMMFISVCVVSAITFRLLFDHDNFPSHYVYRLQNIIKFQKELHCFPFWQL